MPSNRSQGPNAMITVDCPWCDAPADLGEAELHCAACAITVQVESSVREPALAAAA